MKQEAKLPYLLECLQKTAPPVLIFAENKASACDAIVCSSSVVGRQQVLHPPAVAVLHVQELSVGRSVLKEPADVAP